MTDGYFMGREAYCRGDEQNMNPYDDADAQWDEWEDGWIDAARENNAADEGWGGS